MRQVLLALGVVWCAVGLVGCPGASPVAPASPEVDPALPPVDPNGPPVAIRPENLVVLPATGPVTHVLVQNLQDRTCQATVRLDCPAGWKLDAASKQVTIGPRQLARVPFAIEKGIDAESNVYPITVRCEVGGKTIAWDRPVVAATTPYFKPAIDGKIDDWADAVPVTFTAAGKKTVISTYWSRRAFSILVSVEESTHKPMSGGAPFDAVQLAISPAKARTPRSADGRAERYELLLAAGATGARCIMLKKPGEAVSAGHMPRALAGAQLNVWHAGGTTHYECAIPFKAMPTIRAEPGREYRMSLLVHDPDGTGLRDWGRAVGLWPWQRSGLAWKQWQGAAWGDEPPFDNKIEWGFCSSKR